jgi:carbon monoxide dehydrogenase subunit G
MDLKGTQVVAAPRARVWEALNHPDMLRRCTPGCKRLQVSADGGYDTQMELRIGAVQGRFVGKIDVKDSVPGSQYLLKVSASGSTGFLNAEGVVNLEESGSGTRVDYSGTAQIGGAIAGVGQRMADTVARRLVQQFFECFEKALSEPPSEPRP